MYIIEIIKEVKNPQEEEEKEKEFNKMLESKIKKIEEEGKANNLTRKEIDYKIYIRKQFEK